MILNNKNNCIKQMEDWFTACQKNLHIIIKKIPMAESQDWKIIENDDGKSDYIAHNSNRIHKIIFLKAWEPLRNQWVDRCLLEPIAEGKEGVFSIFLLARYENKFLVQAKAEPGNNTLNRVVLTTTVQSSFVNLNMLLSGKIHFVQLYNNPLCKKMCSIQDGGQLFNKISELCFLDLKEKPEQIPDSFYWATIEEIKYFAQKDLVSEHLMQVLGMLYLNF